MSKTNNRAYTPIICRPNDCTYTPTINRPTDRQALCLTTIITVAGTVLPPGRTAAMLAADSDLIITALPAAYQHFAALACSTITNSCCFHLQLNQYFAALLPYCLPAVPQAQRKNCQWWNVWTKVM